MKKTVVAAAIAMVSFSAFAQETILFATGDGKAGSTYSKMYNEFRAVCSTTGQPLGEQQTTGSVQNLQLLTENSVNAAIVQMDQLFFMKMTDPQKVSNIRTLFTLFPEELHFVARGDVKKEGGFMGFGGNSVTFNSLNDLKGRVVGAVGGSVTSGRIVSSQSGLNFQIQEFRTNDEMKDALLTGKVDTILVVGGAPHGMVRGLDGRYKLLSVPADMQKKLSGVYSPAKLSYPNLNQAGIDSIATQAAAVTRTYRSSAMMKSLAAVRQCFMDNAPEIADKKGSHAKWQQVDTADKGKWEWYDLK